jgi:tetratricopeptide (TPR) repeat protein
MAAIAAASAAGMAVMAVLTVMAMQARNEAQSQRAQAEDLIEFMLGDLRKKLDPVGRLDVLDSVGEKALGYYAKQELAGLDANSLGHRSRAMHLIGEMRATGGKLDEALIAFQRAADTTAQLLSRAPNDGQRIFDHAQSIYWLGYINWKRNQAQAAEEAFLKYRELAQQLIRIDANNLDWQLETTSASHNLGVVQLDRRRLAEALRSFSESKGGFSRLISAKPVLARELAEAHGWIAKTLEASGDYAGAIAAQQERLGVLRTMTDSAKDRRAQRQAANANYELGRLQLYLGNPDAAEPLARSAAEQADALTLVDPANLAWLADACSHGISLAEIEFALSRRELARADLERAMAQLSRLIASDASVANWQVSRQGRGLTLAAQFALAEDRGRLSPSVLESYLNMVERFESQGKRLNAEQESIVASVELALGDLLARGGRREAGENHWRAAVERLRSQAENENHPVLTLLARLYLRLDRLGEARALVARVQASKYRHPAYADLVNELTHVAGRGQSKIPRSS